MIQDVHSHTYYSYCGKDSPEALIKKAKNAYELIKDYQNFTTSTGKKISSEAFLDAIDAEIAVISCGTGNKYGHPNQPVLDRYEERGMTVHRTDLEGTIVYSSNGAEFTRVQ